MSAGCYYKIDNANMADSQEVFTRDICKADRTVNDKIKYTNGGMVTDLLTQIVQYSQGQIHKWGLMTKSFHQVHSSGGLYSNLHLRCNNGVL